MVPFKGHTISDFYPGCIHSLDWITELLDRMFSILDKFLLQLKISQAPLRWLLLLLWMVVIMIIVYCIGNAYHNFLINSHIFIHSSCPRIIASRCTMLVINVTVSALNGIKTHGCASAARKPHGTQVRMLFTGTANSLFSTTRISITTTLISMKFTYFIPFIHATLYTKFEVNQHSNLRYMCS